MIEVTSIPYEDKNVLHNLIQLYRYDSSEYDQHAINSHGLYLYKYLDHQWTDDYRRPYFFKVDGEIAGFVLVSIGVPQAYLKACKETQANVISDFFVMRKFRRMGYGRAAAIHIFDKHPGTWEVRQTYRNIPAGQFWNKVINDYTNGNFIETVLDNENWHGPIQVFTTPMK